MSDTALMIMTRYPQKGQVKTRLARHIGEEATLQIYQAFLSDLATRFSKTPYDLYWVYTPAILDFHAALSALLAPIGLPGSSFPQQGDGLGARLLDAFRTISARGYQASILIGSDNPHLAEETILQAREALKHADVVLGPAEDGGYYLIAMGKPYDLFTNIPMSTDAVLRLTMQKAQEQDLRVHLLNPLFDIDEHADLLRLARLLEEEPTVAPATAACLARLKKEIEA